MGGAGAGVRPDARSDDAGRKDLCQIRCRDDGLRHGADAACHGRPERSYGCNLALLRGNIGKPGANICAVRGHSNVQGQRTVGITEKPGLVPLDKLAEFYEFEPPRWTGIVAVETCEAIIRGQRAPSSASAETSSARSRIRRHGDCMARLRLSVNIATKLNRSHVVHGEIAYLLPCLGRIEVDEQASGPQAVSMESSVAHFHGSRGKRQTGQRRAQIGAGDRRRHGEGNAPRETKVRWDKLGRQLRGDPRRDRADLSGNVQGLQQALVPAGRVSETAAGARTQMGDGQSGKANFLTPPQALSRIFEAEAVPTCCSCHAAIQRPVQHDDLWL
jgi:hypothetical protein